jgi:flagellar biosynthesis/type III secretory pathway protein FliH
VTRAHLATLQTRHDPASRHQGKVRLIRELYDRGMSREDVLQLFRIIDWMMDLPQALEQLFRQEAEQIEQERHMPYVTSVERLAKEEGKAEGLIEGLMEGQTKERAAMLIRVLERRFKSTVPEELRARIRGTTDLAVLERWFDLALDVSSLEEFQQRMQS